MSTNKTIGVSLVGILVCVSTSIPSFAQEPADFSPALQILDKHCSKCHQVGKLSEKRKGKPADDFGYVLDVKRMLGKKLIIAGEPLTSPLFTKIQTGEMPKGTDDDCLFIADPKEQAAKNLTCEVPPEEVAVLKKWIEEIPTDLSPTVAQREFVTDDDIVSAMARDIATLSEFVRPNIRYVTFANLYNAGDSDKDMEHYRQAMTKLLNSLSFESSIMKPVVVDAYKTVLRINIQELGWSADKWNAIIKINPYAVFYDIPDFKTLQRETKTVQPFLRGDWLTFSASQPPLYYDLLGLPKHKRDLEKLLGLNVIENINNLRVARAGFLKSGVSNSNRLIERHSSRTGVYWESYDFAGNKDRQSFFKNPFGPIGAFGELSEKHGFVHDGGEVIFELPNGFHGYYLTDEKGNRLDRGPTAIVAHPLRRDYAVLNGISCMGCHDKGIKYNDYRPREKQDQVRDYVLSTAAFALKTNEIIETVFPTHDVFHKLMKQDEERYKQALSRAGVGLDTTDTGLEKVNALFVRFEDNLSMELAAAEFGLTREEFEKRANRHGGDVYELKQRLLSDLVPRDQFVKDFAGIVNKITKNKAIDFAALNTRVKTKEKLKTAHVKPRPPAAAKKFDLAFFPTTHEFVKGEEVAFKLTSMQPCYLTLLNIDQKNRMAVLFPNKFHQDNKIEPNLTYQIPGKELAGFKLKFGDAGKEKVIAICNASRPDPHGIVHDFENDNFTILDFDDVFLTRSLKDSARTRLIVVEKDKKKAEKLMTPREKNFPALLDNPIDPEVDIEARKAVVLHVKGQ